MTPAEITDMMNRSDLADRPEVLKFYEKCLKNGCTPQFAVMLALQEAPRLMTETTYMVDHGTLQKQFAGQEMVLDRIVQVAKSHGHTPGYNDFYDRGLARFQGDPEAFIPPGEGLGYIRRVRRSRGEAVIDVNGKVLEKAREPEKDPHERVGKRLAPDIVQRKLKAALKHPKNREMKRAELVDRIIQKHGG